jgi:hypothetical protein
MSQVPGYNLYWTTMLAKADFTAAAATKTVTMKGLPAGISPTLLVLFLLKTGAETGTSSLILQLQVSHNDSNWFDLGSAETTITAADTDGIHFVPDVGGAKHYRFDITTDATISGSHYFADTEIYAIVARSGVSVNG